MIEWEGATVMVDCGPGYAKVVRPFLMREGIRRIDLAVLTHPEQDHIEGLLALAEDPDFSIGMLVMADSPLQEGEETSRLAELVEEQNGTVLYCGKGEELSFGRENNRGIIRLLWPESPNGEDTALLPTDMNSSSLVSMITLGAMSVVLPGDIDRAAEQILAENWETGPVTVLKLAHHGSDSSSDLAFLSALSPELCVISCGRNNRYGHPGAETLQHLTEAELSWRCTKDHGCIRILVRRNYRTCYQYGG